MKYELTYIISSDENLQGSEEVVKTLESFIIKEGGVIISKENPLAKNLAYPIKKKSSGFFALITFEIDPEKVQAIEEFLKKEQKILRYAMFKKYPVHEKKPRREASFTPKIKKEPSVINKKEEEQPKVELKDIEETLEKILNE